MRHPLKQHLTHHLTAAWFALRCLAWAIAHRPVEFFTQAVLGHSPLNPKE